MVDIPRSWVVVPLGTHFFHLQGLRIPDTPQQENEALHTAVSVDWGLLFLGVLETRTLLFGVCIGAPDFWIL